MLRAALRVLSWFRAHVDELSLGGIGAMFFLVASNTQTGWVYLLSASIFGALLTAWFSSRSALKPRGTRLLVPMRTRRDDLFAATFRWTAASERYPSFLSVDGPLQVEQAGRSCAMLPPTPAGSSVVEQDVWFRPRQRGVWSSLPATLTCYGPLGWFPARRRLQLELSRPLLVLPATFPLSATLLERVAGGLTSLDQNRGARTGGGDLRRLREYQVGDDVRSIHWPSSARAGTMIVREQAHGGGSHLDLCWGSSLPAGPTTPEAEAAFEWLLCWVHSFFQRASESGWQVRLWQPLAADASGGWRVGNDPDVLASAVLPPASGAPPAREEGAPERIEFWLGSCASPGAFEFWPDDYRAGAPPRPPSGRRVGPGQVPE